MKNLKLLFATATLLAVIAAVACTSGTGASEPDIPEVGSTPETPVEVIVERVAAEAATLTSAVGEGEQVGVGVDGERAAATLVAEWVAPNKVRYVLTSIEGEPPGTSEMIAIGNLYYSRSPDADWTSGEIHGRSPDAPINPFGSLDNLALEEQYEVVDYKGSVAYRVSGERLLESDGDEVATSLQPNSPDQTNQQTFYIDAQTYRVLRHETRLSGESFIESTGETETYSIESWYDYSYPETSPVIEAPAEFEEEDSAGPATATAVASFRR